MTVKELEQILVGEKLSSNSYSLSEATFIKASEGFLIRKAEHGKWKLIFEERNKQEVDGIYNNEHQVCIAFLKAMAACNRRFQKYIPKSETIK